MIKILEILSKIALYSIKKLKYRPIYYNIIIRMYIYIIILFVILVWRHLLLKQLRGVRSRDVHLLERIRIVLRLLCSTELPRFDPSKDRRAFIPGQSRRKKIPKSRMNMKIMS